MARLEVWAENTLKVVDERGDCTARVRLLTTDGACWQTWDAPFGDVSEWCQLAETLISELSEEFTGEVQFVFSAESASGTVRAQLPRRTMGKRSVKGAGVGAGLLGGGGPSGALQAMYEAQAKTVEKTLQSANVQLEVLTRTVETQAKAHAELLEYVRVKNETEAMEQKTTQTVHQLLGSFLEQAPLLLELIKENAAKKKAGGALATVVASAKESVGQALTEAAATAASNGATAAVGALVGKG